METKPGWKTSEFWLNVFVQVVSAGVLLHLIPHQQQWLDLVVAIGQLANAYGYTKWRALTKLGNPPVPPAA
ncbi:MAG: hypothetical protein ACYDBB_27155 [Armatimonadota bacterium]